MSLRVGSAFDWSTPRPVILINRKNPTTLSCIWKYAFLKKTGEGNYTNDIGYLDKEMIAAYRKWRLPVPFVLDTFYRCGPC